MRPRRLRPPRRRRVSLGLLVLVVLALAVALALLPGEDGEYFAGEATVTDADTLVVAGRSLRLSGLDAPESRQMCERGGVPWPCGADATEALRGFLRGRPVRCRSEDTDRYGRAIAACRVDGQDVGAWLVREGWAVAYTRYSWRYLPEELAARHAGRGLWGGSFETPEEWRRRAR